MIYVDLMEVKSPEDLARRIVTSILATERKDGFIQRALPVFSMMRPSFGLDPITGMPTINVNFSTPVGPESVAGALDLVPTLYQKGKPLVFVFDEFQDILKMSGHDTAKRVLAALRSKIQFHKDIPYVFSGSVRHDMDDLFINSDSPFFKSAVLVEVAALPREAFEKFLTKRFASGKRTIAPTLFQRIFEICLDIPGDIQQLCSALWDLGEPHLTDDLLGQALEGIWSQEMKGYETALRMLSDQQLRMLNAIARFGCKAPTSAEFLREVGGIMPSSAKAALDRLVTLRLVFYYRKEYRFVNPFFRAWIAVWGSA